MGDISYKPLIEDMTFSYSRINLYHSCPFAWKLNYIDCLKREKKFYSTFGSLVHSVLEKYLKHKITKSEMPVEFLTRFSTDVKGVRPSSKIVESYISNSLAYLNSFKDFDINIIGVEEKINFEIQGVKMTGVIDVVGEKDGEYYIVDHKSHDLKQRSKRAKPTIKDKELDEYLRQLYLYSTAIKNKYGKYPKELWFNCFRTGTLIKEEFKIEGYNEAVEWAISTIDQIKEDTDFEINEEFFYCKYICDQSKNCDEYWIGDDWDGD